MAWECLHWQSLHTKARSAEQGVVCPGLTVLTHDCLHMVCDDATGSCGLKTVGELKNRHINVCIYTRMPALQSNCTYGIALARWQCESSCKCVLHQRHIRQGRPTEGKFVANFLAKPAWIYVLLLTTFAKAYRLLHVQLSAAQSRSRRESC